ncbi:hypothetical protein PCIT_a3837 [Pseudoalteromonas citrea]|uniref:Uncharacterized protein n=2 Tax=Pseudoalteromonas citrea TaxID=43655 RepID=A0AAD4FQX1_9GAMM|nr:hypothetical protein [Pseudoalteromonas citrea]KAF7767749.1 hypothetical protein PCIT_a3837 [Pseudoalteromonas citrea]
MKVNIVVLLLILVTGCSKESQDHTNDLIESDTIKINEQKLFGAWVSSDSLDGFEFHASPTKIGSLNADFTITQAHLQKEGVMFKGNRASNYFTWNIGRDGQLRLDLKDISCQSRPLVLCDTTSRLQIEVLGKEGSLLEFRISEEKNLDGIFDNGYSWQLKRKQLPNITFDNMAYLIEDLFSVSRQSYLTSGNSGLELYLSRNESDWRFVEQERSEYSISFTHNEAFTTANDFYIYNLGERELSVKHTFDYVNIYPSFNGELLLSYSNNRQFSEELGVDINQVDPDGYIFNLKRTHAVSLVEPEELTFKIKDGSTYYSNFSDVFGLEWLDTDLGNSLKFIGSKAYISSLDVLTGSALVTAEFDWRYGESNYDVILENDRVIFKITFLNGDAGRYRVITSNYDKQEQEYTVRNNLDYFFEKNSDIFLDEIESKHFEFINLNAVVTSRISLLEDGDIELGGIDNVEGGRWFLSDHNEITRFECQTISEVEIKDFQGCLDSFRYVATEETKTSYSHITKVRFLNKINDSYLVQYDAAFWGGRWGREDHIGYFSTYYIWKHLPVKETK